MPIPISNPPGGYSWLGVSVPGTSIPTKGLSHEQDKRLEDDCHRIEESLLSFENKIHRYNALCRKYRECIHTKQATGILKQMEMLRKEINSMSNHISQTLDDTIEITHPKFSKEKTK